MDHEVAVDGIVDGWKERRFAKPREQPESLQLVLDRVLHLGHAQLDARRVQGVVQFSQHVGRGHVHTGDGFRRNDQPAHGRRRRRHGVEHSVIEQFGVGEKQRRIPAKQHQAGDKARVGITLDVVVALDPLGLPQHRGIRPPAIPQKFDDGDHDGQPDALDRTEHGHADGADDRQPELPALDAINAPQVGDFNQADGRRDHDRCQCAAGQTLQQVRRHHQQQGNGQRADNPGQLGFGACGFGHGGT